MKLENIIKHLRAGVDADIWYDAGLYQDKGTAKQIAKVQKAMVEAANYIVYMEEEARRVHRMPMLGPKTHGGGKSELICDTKSQNHVEVAVEEYWGSRCPEVAEGCATCDAWAEYDALQGSNYDTVIGNTLKAAAKPWVGFVQVCATLDRQCPQPHLCAEGCVVQDWKTPTPPEPEVCDTTSQDVVDAMDKLIAKLRDIEDLSAIMRQRQREGTTMPLDELERRLKWCKDECRLLIRRVT